MLLLRSKFERACFVVGIVGFTVFGIGLYGWFQDANHSFTNYITYIPDYPPDLFNDNRNRTSFVQHYLSCEWTNPAPPGDVYDPTDLVFFPDDVLLSIEPRCMSSILDVERSTQKKLVALGLYRSPLGLSVPRYGIALAMQAHAKREGLSEAPYKNYVRTKFQEAGWPENIADQVYEKCLVVKKTRCVETEHLTHFYFLSIIKANTSLLIGVILLTVGFAGAFFSGALKWAWHISIGRVLTWIKGE